MSIFRKKAPSHTRLDEMEFRQVERVVGIKKVLPFLAILFLFFLLLLFSLLCIRPWNELTNLEQERSFAMVRLQKSQDKREQVKKHYVWMVEDPAYFELIARDKNSLAKPNEVLIVPEDLPRTSPKAIKP